MFLILDEDGEGIVPFFSGDDVVDIISSSREEKISGDFYEEIEQKVLASPEVKKLELSDKKYSRVSLPAKESKKVLRSNQKKSHSPTEPKIKKQKNSFNKKNEIKEEKSDLNLRDSAHFRNCSQLTQKSRSAVESPQKPTQRRRKRQSEKVEDITTRARKLEKLVKEKVLSLANGDRELQHLESKLTQLQKLEGTFKTSKNEEKIAINQNQELKDQLSTINKETKKMKRSIERALNINSKKDHLHSKILQINSRLELMQSRLEREDRLSLAEKQQKLQQPLAAASLRRVFGLWKKVHDKEARLKIFRTMWLRKKQARIFGEWLRAWARSKELSLAAELDFDQVKEEIRKRALIKEKERENYKKETERLRRVAELPIEERKDEGELKKKRKRRKRIFRGEMILRELFLKKLFKIYKKREKIKENDLIGFLERQKRKFAFKALYKHLEAKKKARKIAASLQQFKSRETASKGFEGLFQNLQEGKRFRGLIDNCDQIFVARFFLKWRKKLHIKQKEKNLIFSFKEKTKKNSLYNSFRKLKSFYNNSYKRKLAFKILLNLRLQKQCKRRFIQFSQAAEQLGQYKEIKTGWEDRKRKIFAKELFNALKREVVTQRGGAGVNAAALRLQTGFVRSSFSTLKENWKACKHKEEKIKEFIKRNDTKRKNWLMSLLLSNVCANMLLKTNMRIVETEKVKFSQDGMVEKLDGEKKQILKEKNLIEDYNENLEELEAQIVNMTLFRQILSVN